MRRLLQQALNLAQTTPNQAAGDLLEIEQKIVGAMVLALTAEPDREPGSIARRLQAFECARDYRAQFSEFPAQTLNTRDPGV